MKLSHGAKIKVCTFHKFYLYATVAHKYVYNLVKRQNIKCGHDEREEMD